MGWLLVTEFTAQFLGDGYAHFNCAKPLVEQRLMIDSQPTRSRAFGMETNLIHVRADSNCMIEIDTPSVSEDIAAGANQYLAVTPGAVLTVIEDALAPAPAESIPQETSCE
jgi:hypothetical protein